MSRILILGVSGMLGNAMLRVMSEFNAHEVWGTARTGAAKLHFAPPVAERIKTGIDVENIDSLAAVFAEVKPEVVINCIGLVKQLQQADDPLAALPINALLPHRLARLCSMVDARLIHISTDCVFSGMRGNYVETDHPDATDLYGRSKLLGEVAYSHTVTLRTSIIGHELSSAHGLLGWFLAQKGPIKGYRRAVFSGLPTVELAHIVRDIVIPRQDLNGVYHIAAEPISKYELLMLVREIYGTKFEILPNEQMVIDRSLNAARFRKATGYIAPPWPELVTKMRDFH